MPILENNMATLPWQVKQEAAANGAHCIEK
jgi:hypothetical protein